jgi:hypothetical protein
MREPRFKRETDGGAYRAWFHAIALRCGSLNLLFDRLVIILHLNVSGDHDVTFCSQRAGHKRMYGNRLAIETCDSAC